MASTISCRKRLFVEEEEEEKRDRKRQKVHPDYRKSNRFIDLINNKHMFSVIHSFIGNDCITAARMRSAFPVKSLNPYMWILLNKPLSYQIAIKYVEESSSVQGYDEKGEPIIVKQSDYVQVFVRSVSPDYDHDARDTGVRYERIDSIPYIHIPPPPGTIIARSKPPTLQFFMYMRPDALPLNKDEYCETFKSIDDVPSFYVNNAYTFVLDYQPNANPFFSAKFDCDVLKFHKLTQILPLVIVVFLDNPANGRAWHDNKKLINPHTKYQIQFGTNAVIRVLDHEYSVYYSDPIYVWSWGANLNGNRNRARFCEWL
jgi:hypothetical protein